MAGVVAGTARLAVASVPVGIAVVFMPTAIHVYRPGLVTLQLMLLPEPVAAELAVTVTDVISAVA